MQGNIILTPLVGAAAYLKLAAFAEGGPALDPGVSSLVGNLGVVGFLIWFVWHQTKYGQPEMIKTFALEQQKQRDANQAAMEKLRETFETQQAELRAAFDREMAALRLHSEKERAHNAKETAELRGLVMQLMGGFQSTSKDFRTSVHDVRDIAQTAINQQALADERNKGGRQN